VTFVELLLAIVVFLVGLSGAIQALFACQDLSEHAQEVMIALDDLKDVMEEIHATPFESLPVRFPEGVADGSAAAPYAAVVGGYTLPAQRITVTYAAQSSDRRELVATLTWLHRSRSRTLSLSTVRTSTL
jgi:hypothetical protein